MKNNNEILSIMEDEFVRLVGFHNLYANDWIYRTEYYCKIMELVQLCEKTEIPFDWEWKVLENEGRDIIKSITIAGKRIEFE